MSQKAFEELHKSLAKLLALLDLLCFAIFLEEFTNCESQSNPETGFQVEHSEHTVKERLLRLI